MAEPLACLEDVFCIADDLEVLSFFAFLGFSSVALEKSSSNAHVGA